MFDTNVIQAPELIRRLATRLGLRQPHITPQLNNGVQAVVVLDDLSEPEKERLINTSVASRWAFVPSPTLLSTDEFWAQFLLRVNATGAVMSGRSYRIRRLLTTSAQSRAMAFGWRDSVVNAGASLTQLINRDRRAGVSTSGVLPPRDYDAGANININTGLGVSPNNFLDRQMFSWQQTVGVTVFELNLTFGPGTGFLVQTNGNAAAGTCAVALELEEENT